MLETMNENQAMSALMDIARGKNRDASNVATAAKVRRVLHAYAAGQRPTTLHGEMFANLDAWAESGRMLNPLG